MVTAIDARIAAAAGGDRGAAQSLCRELLPRVRNLVRYLVRGDARVDDIAQEALIGLTLVPVLRERHLRVLRKVAIPVSGLAIPSPCHTGVLHGAGSAKTARNPLPPF